MTEHAHYDLFRNTSHKDSRYGRHSYILANWVGEDGEIDTKHGLRPGRIQQIFTYKFLAGDGKPHSIMFATVEWYKIHPNRNMFGVGIELVSVHTFLYQL